MRDIFRKSNSIKYYLDELYSAPRYHFESEEFQIQCEAIGFKLMFNQAKNNPSILRYIKNQNISVVHIVRRNILNILVSRKINSIFDIANTKESIITPRVELNVKKL
ncbi:MAG: hypothetical protein P8X88_09675, partial [Gammaproteobacteria bacterium]